MGFPKPKIIERDGKTLVVTHCCHPTALWPYAIADATGALVVAPNGNGFQYQQDAIVAATLLLEGRATTLPNRRGTRRFVANTIGDIREAWALIHANGGVIRSPGRKGACHA